MGALRNPEVGDTLAGTYKLTRRLGVGGMGVVFAAHHELLGNDVALKILLAGLADSDVATRTINEAKTGARLRSEHAARVYDVGRLEDGRPYISMELLEGEDLSALLARSGPLAVTQVVDFLLEALDALAEAHALGVIHRDLKPSNLFIARRPDGAEVLKVLDFGLAKVARENAHAKSLTSADALLGSPRYLSPEQLRNPKNVGPDADIWSLGVVAYELLVGVTPFPGEALPQILIAVASAPIPSVREVRPDVPEGLASAIGRAMSRDAAARFRDCASFARALRPFASPLGALVADRLLGDREPPRSSSGVSISELAPPVASAASRPSRVRLLAGLAAAVGGIGIVSIATVAILGRRGTIVGEVVGEVVGEAAGSDVASSLAAPRVSVSAPSLAPPAPPPSAPPSAAPASLASAASSVGDGAGLTALHPLVSRRPGVAGTPPPGTASKAPAAAPSGKIVQTKEQWF